MSSRSSHPTLKRISVGGALARAALGTLAEAGREMLHDGTFGWTGRAIGNRDLARLLE